MTLKDLSEGLQEIAAEVRTVDLYDRAIRSSRRMRARKAAAIMSAGLCVLALLIVGLANLGPDGARTGDAALDASGSATAEDAPLATGLSTAYYLKQDAATAYTVYAWDQDDEPAEVLSGDDLFGETVAISPDGRYAAYYADEEMLVVTLPPASSGPVAQFPVRGDACLEPTWTADSANVLMVAEGTGDAQLVSFDGGTPASTAVHRPGGCHARLFEYGENRLPAYVYADTDANAIRYQDAFEGSELAPPTEYDSALRLTGVASVSADGGYQCVAMVYGDDPGDDGRVLHCDTLATYRGPATVALPIEGQLLAAAFSPLMALDAPTAAGAGPEFADTVLRIRTEDGSQLLVHTTVGPLPTADAWTEATIPDLAVLDSATEPDMLAEARMLTYVP